MKVVIAIDSFKGSVSSVQAATAIREGILHVIKDAEVIIKPLADGGEGTVEALVEGTDGTYVTMNVTGPIYDTVQATYGILGDGVTAVIEMAQAAGLPQVPVEQRNPLVTTTYGVGELIKDAVKRGCRSFLIGIGGSATNDMGIGMLQALGYRFYDGDGRDIGQGGQGLEKIVTIDTKNVLPELELSTFQIACDVDNPLYGENGAAYVYGRQKGATNEMMKQLDEGMKSFANVISTQLQEDVAHVPGAGAAGGLGASFLAFFNSRLQSGVDIVMKQIELEKVIVGADVVVTGEGRIDFQTAMGKAPIGVAKLGKKHGAKVIAFAGATTHDAIKVNEVGIDSFFSICNSPMSVEEAMNQETTKQNLRITTIQVFSLLKG